MLVYSEFHKTFILDPHMLALLPFQAIKNKNPKDYEARCLYIYHMFHPKSPFWEYKKSTKSIYVVQSLFPKERQGEPMKWEPYATEFEASMMPKEQWEAQQWYLKNLKLDPLWAVVEGYNDAMYNLTAIVKDASKSASEIRIARNELDELPKSRQKMQEQAQANQAFTLKVAGDKKIRRSERLPSDSKRQGSKSQNAPSNSVST